MSCEGCGFEVYMGIFIGIWDSAGIYIVVRRIVC